MTGWQPRIHPRAAGVLSDPLQKIHQNFFISAGSVSPVGRAGGAQELRPPTWSGCEGSYDEEAPVPHPAAPGNSALP
ncbi:MAG: hypothetical protein MZV70_45820 [Desulfobacterales bacterium]|nr:hypothetical protein [Desulfobacterales bacterium]